MEHQLVIYVGEDERVFRELECQLEPRGYELEWFDNATPIAEERLCNWQRLLIIDADLTTAAGLELLQSVKARDMGTPVIVVTDNKTLTNVGVARLNGADALFFKPFSDFESVLEVIETAFFRLDYWCHVSRERATPI